MQHLHPEGSEKDHIEHAEAELKKHEREQATGEALCGVLRLRVQSVGGKNQKKTSHQNGHRGMNHPQPQEEIGRPRKIPLETLRQGGGGEQGISSPRSSAARRRPASVPAAAARRG